MWRSRQYCAAGWRRRRLIGVQPHVKAARIAPGQARRSRRRAGWDAHLPRARLPAAAGHPRPGGRRRRPRRGPRAVAGPAGLGAGIMSSGPLSTPPSTASRHRAPSCRWHRRSARGVGRGARYSAWSPPLGEVPEPPACDDLAMEKTLIAAGRPCPDHPKASRKWRAQSDGHVCVVHVLYGHPVRSPRRVRQWLP